VPNVGHELPGGRSRRNRCHKDSPLREVTGDQHPISSNLTN